MRRLSVFNLVSLDGYFKGPNGDIGWHSVGEEQTDFAVEAAGAGGPLLFGRVTYELMAGYWPAPLALENDPILAARMNSAPKVVFSRTLTKAEWNNTRLVKDNIIEEMRNLKRQPGKDMTILGSGSIVTQFAEQGLIDEYQVLVNPVALGDGTPLFKGMKKRLNLKLLNTRTFRNGNVLLTYEPVKP